MNRFVQMGLCAGWLACCSALAGQENASQTRVVEVRLAEQPMSQALNELAFQTGVRVVFFPQAVQGMTAPRLNGAFTPDEAFKRLLSGSALTWRFTDARTVEVRAASKTQETAGAPRAPGAMSMIRLAQSDEDSAAVAPVKAQTDAGSGSVPEILVKGARSLNLDIERSRDGAQPYMVFDRETIERSGAQSIQEFVQTRLTANTAIAVSPGQSTTGSNGSIIDLRGLGRAQTLILIDGHRIASENAAGSASQPDINGIPLSAIERIEVLPATAAGAYGGSATGGVVNIILRRDFSGVEARLTYGGTVDGGGEQRRIDVAAGHHFAGGKTSLMVSGSWSDTDPLLVKDRDFLRRGREQLLLINRQTLYGAANPPLGATTNIKSSDGSPLTFKADYGGGAVGDSLTFVPLGYDGPASDNGQGLIDNAGQYNLDAANTAQISGGGLQALYNSAIVRSLRATVRHQFTAKVQGFVEAAHAENAGASLVNNVIGSFSLPASAPGNPFEQNIRVTTPVLGGDGRSVSRTEDTRLVAGATVELSPAWSAEVDFTWNRNFAAQTQMPLSLATSATSLVNSGAIDLFRDTNEHPVDFSEHLGLPSVTSPTHVRLRGLAIRFGGMLPWTMPGGAPSLSTLLERREEKFDNYVTNPEAFGTIAYARSQEVDSAYLETRLPLVSGRNARPGLRGLEMIVSARSDHYNLLAANAVPLAPGVPPAPPERARTKFSSLDYTVAAKYQPVSGLALRASFGTGFTPPSLFQLVPSPKETIDAGLFGLTDPQRGGEPLGIIDYFYGGNPGLRPEQSESRSAGIVLEPAFAEGLRISVDWVRIDKRDNVTSIGLLPESLAIEDRLPAGTVVRAAPSDAFPVGPIVAFNSTYLNALSQRVEAYDLALDYRLDGVLGGTLTLTGMATRNVTNKQDVLPGVPGVETAGTTQVHEWTGHAGAIFDRGPWSASWTVRAIDGYWITSAHNVIPSQGSARIGSQHYHDLSFAYRFEARTRTLARLLAGTDWQLSIKNVLNKEPPYFGFPPYYSQAGDPRLAMYHLSVRKAFD